MNNQQLGKWGEDTAQSYLEEKGYRILCRNYRCRVGEIDIIASKGKELHFIEVKTRQGNSFGHPAESVTDKKQSHMKAAVCKYLSDLMQSTTHPPQIQMDVIELEINHLENI